MRRVSSRRRPRRKSSRTWLRERARSQPRRALSPVPHAMTARRLALVLLVVAVAVAGLIALAIDNRPPLVSPTEQVPTTWATARDAPMHQFHVGEKKIACTECHARPGEGPTSAACAKCHDVETQRHHPLADPDSGLTGAPKSCLSCHAFGLQPAATCAECHSKAKRAPGAPPLDHHVETGIACATCHRAHGEKPAEQAACSTCHSTVEATHGRWSSALDASMNSAACTDCHAPHLGKEAAQASCKDCHATPHARSDVPSIAFRGTAHADCTTCHEPHRARREDVRSCEGCHADHRDAVEDPGHRSCRTCHAPHAPGEAKGSCTTTCHAGVKAMAASRVTAHADCTSCHDPHRPNSAPERACVRCHENTKPTHPPTASEKGGQTCTGCHTPHAKTPTVSSDKTVGCASCHSAKKSEHSSHGTKVACVQCHTPHAFRLAEAEPTLCGKCHEPIRAKTVTRAGHTNCNGCHGSAHEPTTKPACVGCHAEESKTAPPGHANCTSCHDAHSGALGNRASCTQCHRDKESALHAHATPQGCATCHRAHGPRGIAAPKDCTSCHSRPSLGGLHSVGAHGPCASCHTAHASPRSDRTTCTGSCHTQRRDHQPEAKVCKGCHLFRK